MLSLLQLRAAPASFDLCTFYPIRGSSPSPAGAWSHRKRGTISQQPHWRNTAKLLDVQGTLASGPLPTEPVSPQNVIVSPGNHCPQVAHGHPASSPPIARSYPASTGNCTSAHLSTLPAIIRLQPRIHTSLFQEPLQDGPQRSPFHKGPCSSGEVSPQLTMTR